MQTPTAPAPEMTTAPKLFTCAKCDGRGRLNWTRIANGVCFACKGTGKIENDGITDDAWYRGQISHLQHTSEAAMWGIDNGRDDYAEHYMRAMIPGLRKIGTEGAREVLKYIRAGEYYETSTDTTHRITNEQATRIIARIIELGHEARAAEQASA